MLIYSITTNKHNNECLKMFLKNHDENPLSVTGQEFPAITTWQSM